MKASKCNIMSGERGLVFIWKSWRGQLSFTGHSLREASRGVQNYAHVKRSLTARWCWCPGPRNWYRPVAHTGQNSVSPHQLWRGMERWAHRPAPAGTGEYMGMASGKERSSAGNTIQFSIYEGKSQQIFNHKLKCKKPCRQHSLTPVPR